MKHHATYARPSARLSIRRLPLCIAITAALATGIVAQARAATTTTTVPAGTVVTKTADYYLGRLPTDNDTLNVLGAGTQWNNTENLYVGSQGTGTLNVRDSGKVTAKTLAIGVKSTVNLDGGTLQIASGTIATGGVFNWTQGTLGLKGGASLGTGLLAAKTTLDAGKTLRVDKTLGFSGPRTSLTLDGGALIVHSSELGPNNSFKWIKGTLGYSEDATSGDGLLISADARNIGTGKTLVVAGTLSEAKDRGLTLDGGTIQTGNWNGGPQFQWTKGTVAFTGDYGLLGAIGLPKGAAVDQFTNLTTGKTLTVAKELTIASDAKLTLDGGTLQVGSGILLKKQGPGASVGVFNWIKGTLGYTGDASIGSGLLASTTTVGLGKTLNVNGNLTNNNGTLNILDSGKVAAQTLAIKGTLNLGEGAQLSTVNGTTNNNTVSFNGNSTIQGNFTNNGSVIGSAGTLSFLNDVNGAGSYAGNIAFKAAFNPGNSPAAVSFNGGNATFDSASVLNMEIFGSTPGAQYDQLVSINTLTFNGTLNLVFGNGYVPLAGSSFALFGFNNFSGSFGAAADSYSKITVAGYDKSKLDFSHLATDGTISVTAVPEPDTYAMLLAGLALMGTVARRRARKQHAA